MTLPSTVHRNDYVGSGITGPYAYNFPIFAYSDLLVTTQDLSGVQATLSYPADFSATGLGDAAGGSITLTAALTTGWLLSVQRVRPLTQLTSVRNQGSVFPATYEDAFDNAMMVDVQQQDAIDRSIKLPVTEIGTTQVVLPTASQRASKVLGFDGAGAAIALPVTLGVTGGVAASPFMTTRLVDATAAAARAGFGGLPTFVTTIASLKALISPDLIGEVFVLGYYTPGDGGGGSFRYNAADASADNGGTVIAPTVGTGRWNRIDPDNYNVLKWGAKGDGVTDDYAAIQACIDAAIIASGTVYLPGRTAGTFYHIATGLTVTLADTQRFSMRGDGLFSYLYFDTAGSTGMTITGVGRAIGEFSNFALGGAAATYDGISIDTLHRSTWRDVWVTGCGRYAWRIRGSFLNTFHGGGFSRNIGAPVAGALVVPPVMGLRFEGSATGGFPESNSNTFIGTSWEGAFETRQTITAASNATPIQITTATPHGYATGDIVAIMGVTGNTAANGSWTITKVDASNYTLNASVGNGAYAGGGTSVRGVGVLFTNSTHGNNIFLGGTIENNGTGIYIAGSSATGNGFLFCALFGGNDNDFTDLGTGTQWWSSFTGSRLHSGQLAEFFTGLQIGGGPAVASPVVGVSAGGYLKQVTWGKTAAVADQTLINHGMNPYTPTCVIAAGVDVGYTADIVSVASWGDTNFLINIQKRSDGTAGTAKPIMWIAFR